MNQRKRVLITRPWPQACIERAQASYEVEVWQEHPDATGLGRAMAEFDALCPTITDRIDREVLRALPRRVAVISNFGAGVDHIDLAAASEQGVTVSNTPDVLTEATAETAILLMLMVARKAGAAERRLRAGQWDGWRPTGEIGQGLGGKVLGLVGFGRIAQATAHIARGHGMEVLYHSRSAAPVLLAEQLGVRRADSIDELLKTADVVSLHCPGGAETRHLIDARALSIMKPAAMLINTARGTIVDEEALAAALKEERLYGAGLDVYEREPAIHPALLASERAVLLPHIGSATIETRQAMGMRALDNLDAFFGRGMVLDRVA